MERIFHRVVESDPEQRSLVLDEVCGTDSELRAHVEALLSSDRSAQNWMQTAVRSEYRALAFSLTGSTVSHYRILSGVDAGGMGLVYCAEDIKLGRRVAIKFLPAESGKDPAALRRFEREARAASALEHPNICPIYEFGEHEGQSFLVMPLLNGQTLRELIASVNFGTAPLETSRLLGIAIQIVDGLDAAHRHGIIHRDIKPANIFLTRQGEVKILDFGLAKLVDADSDVNGRESVRPPADLLLSRTGTAMGTAAYMAPEQIRGQPVDVRTDLFSFGLVLYEMATGRRAFDGATDILLRSKILQKTPQRVHKLNPNISPRLEQIIDKAIAKDPDQRFQTAAQIRQELQSLKDLMARPRSWRWKAIIASTALAVLMITAILWNVFRPHPPEVFREFKQRQLTVNSSENPVTGGAISPDGKYLVYSDLNGMYLKNIVGGKTRALSLPDVSGETKPNWQIGTWLPDSTRFFAIAELPQRPSSLWSISTTGGIHHKLAEASNPWGVSPEGSWVAVTRSHNREIWMLQTNGEHARKLYETQAGSHFRAVHWSADGKRMAFIRISPASGAQLELGDPEGRPPKVLLSGAEARDISLLEDSFINMTWLPDGRLIYVGGEESIHGMSCNLFEAFIDSRTSALIAKPHRLTNWAGFCVATFAATADGKKLTFNRSSASMTVYLADFDPARLRLSTPRRLTFTDDLSSPTGWTPDSSSVLVRSNREESWGIYQQPVSGAPSEPLVTGLPDVSWRTPVTPDGKWLLYGTRDPSRSAMRWMRTPLSGGASEEIAHNKAAVLCPRTSASSCVGVELGINGKKILFRAFDPVHGSGQELARFQDEHADEFGFDLSPDGGAIVLFRHGGNRLRVISLRNASSKEEVRLPDDIHLTAVSWAANAKGWFVSNHMQKGAELLYIDRHGNVRPLWHLDGYEVSLFNRPSPDSCHLAIQGSAGSSNMWLMESF